MVAGFSGVLMARRYHARGAPGKSARPLFIDTGDGRAMFRRVSLSVAPDGSVIDRKRVGRRRTRFTKDEAREIGLRAARKLNARKCRPSPSCLEDEAISAKEVPWQAGLPDHRGESSGLDFVAVAVRRDRNQHDLAPDHSLVDGVRPLALLRKAKPLACKTFTKASNVTPDRPPGRMRTCRRHLSCDAKPTKARACSRARKHLSGLAGSAI